MALQFVAKHNGQRNLYYAVNPLRGPVTKKAAKTDVAAIEYLFADLDPQRMNPRRLRRRAIWNC